MALISMSSVCWRGDCHSAESAGSPDQPGWPSGGLPRAMHGREQQGLLSTGDHSHVGERRSHSRHDWIISPKFTNQESDITFLRRGLWGSEKGKGKGWVVHLLPVEDISGTGSSPHYSYSCQ